MYTQAIEINPTTMETIARTTPFTTTVLAALDAANRANSPYRSTYVVKDRDGSFHVVPCGAFHTYGFKSSKTTWFDIALNY